MRCKKVLEYERDIELLKSELAHERADNLELMIALSEKEAIAAEADIRLAQAKEAYVNFFGRNMRRWFFCRCSIHRLPLLSHYIRESHCALIESPLIFFYC